LNSPADYRCCVAVEEVMKAKAGFLTWVGIIAILIGLQGAWAAKPQDLNAPAAPQPSEPVADDGTINSPALQDPNTPENTAEPTTSDALGTAGSDASSFADLSQGSGGGREGPNYVIGPEDVISIDVFNVPELSKLLVRVANDGTITVPLIGQVKAAGLTAQQLREELAQKWGENYLQNPEVTLFIRQFRARPVSVVGAVEKPGLYPLTGRRNLIEVLSMAGGLGKKNSQAAGRSVYITRSQGFGDLQPTDGLKILSSDKVEIDLQKLLYSQNDALNIEIKPLDTVSVAKAPIIYVVGEVKKPGGFPLEDQERVTVLQALAMAEGLSGSPAKSLSKIIRRGPDGVARKEIPIDLGKIMKGEATDVELAANDILFIPLSGGKYVGKRAVENAIGVVTGLIIWGRL
jgi:polysaccharide export outer membrane protein